MPLSVSRGDSFSLSAAKRNERNILARLQRSNATKKLFHDLWRDRAMIEEVVAHHLRRDRLPTCHVQEPNTWMIGHFNICIMVHVHHNVCATSKMVFRCPMPYKVGEQYYPGAVDEKLRAEVGTYAWIEDNCPDIPIPCLRGFGLSRSLQFTHRVQGTGYDLDPSGSEFDRPYMLLDFIGEDRGTMLAETLKEFRETDPDRLQNLVRGISRIMISLARKAQPRIGSLRFNDDGFTTLRSRPLFCANSILESEGAPRVSNKTYTTTGSLIDDMLQFRKEAFLAQPNAVNDEEDCLLQMCHMVLLQRMKAHFIDRHYGGPFILQFTDFHAGNILVDEDWNIVAVIDLEFVCALPPSMMEVPYWLLVDTFDKIIDRADDFARIHKQFLDTMRDEEKTHNREHGVSLASSIQEAWTTRSCWFYSCFTSINGIPACLEDHLYGKFGFDPSVKEERLYAKLLSTRWSPDSKAVVEQKLRDKAGYDEDLRKHFEENHGTENRTAPE